MAPLRADFHKFDEVYHFHPKYTYPKDVLQDIDHSRRLSKKDLLFIDKLLGSIGVDSLKTYPPENNKELRKLHKAIVGSGAPEHIIHAILYYLLKDVKIKSDIDHAGQFAGGVFLSQKYWTLIDGLWAMDRRSFNTAIEYLTQPSLTPTYPDDILLNLIDNEEYQLAFSYYQCVQPPLTNSELLHAYFHMISKANPTEALFFSRMQPESSRRILFEKMTINAMSAADPDRATRGVQLIDLPLDKEEEEWFQEFLEVGEGRHHKYAPDMMLMRKIAKGRFGEATVDVKTKDVSTREYRGVRWDNVIDGLSKGLGPRDVAGIYQKAPY
ncbi:hypothetical protein EJ08DRAFT_650336 [Tothia fuscella]|uniref:ELYS-like domain-containing protein n=1 Tax=Tothia fuscella TaxID=1048955 RepID=A0A9P4TWP4_9PEZI|nr:hypothetical protein EJ08DRAFT_650336 [Tothia fuscella]